MLKEQKNQVFVFGIVAILGISLATPVAKAALDVDMIMIMTELEHVDGSPDGDYPWDFEISVSVSDPGTLHHIDVTKPGASGPSHTIFEDEPSSWEFDPDKHTSLDALRADYPEGLYTLEFRDIGGTLLKTVSLDYSGLSAPASNVDFTYPSSNGQTGVSTNPTFTWTIAADAADFLALGIDDEDTGEQVYGAYPVSMTTLSWSPGPLPPNHEYHLDVTVSEVKNWVGPDLPTMTVGDDEFTYYLTFDYINTISFTTSALANYEVIFPLQVGEVWEFIVTDSRDPGNPWTREWHVLDIVDIAGSDYYPLSTYDYKTGEWETGVAYVNSDHDNVYLWDEGVYKVWPLSIMTNQHVVVPYGEFDAYYYDEGDWYNFFAPGVGYIKWIQFESEYTVTGELVDIHTEDAAAEALIKVQAVINQLPPESLHNKNSANALINKIDAALAMIDAGLYQETLDKLENDILKKTNGCAETGMPDRNDWIITCEAQAEVYPIVVQAIELLESLI